MAANSLTHSSENAIRGLTMSMNREQKRMLQRQGEVDSSNLSVATSIGTSVATDEEQGPPRRAV